VAKLPVVTVQEVVVRFAEFELDLRSGELRTNGTSVRLQPQPAKILALLVRRRGETVTRDEIIEEVWGSDTFVDYEQGLNFAIRQIRNALGDDAGRPVYVETVPKRGYRFVAPCDSRRMRSLAVLPLENLSHDPQQEYFAEGLTEALIAALARIGELRVISRTSAMQYKGVRKPLVEIARELKVDTIIEGTVLRVGRRVRITMQLIDAPKETHLWAGSYERDLRNVLALQSEVAQTIAREVQVKLTPQEQVQFAQVHLVDPEAYEAYLKGRYHWSRGSSESLSRAIQYFNDAIRSDPSYAPGYAGLADAYSDLAVFNFQPPTEAFPKAKAAALRAIEVDSDLGEAHGALAAVAWAYDWDWLGAEREYEKAFQLNPVSAGTHLRYSVYLVNMGRFDGAISEVRKAHKLDPLSPIATATVGWVYMLARRYEEALAWYNKALELEPNVGALTRADIAWTYALKGAYAEAIAEYEKLPHRPTPAENQAVAGGLGFLLAVSSRRREALDIIAQLKALSESRYIDGCMVAAIYAGLGDQDHAFEWLTKAYEERSSSMVFLKVNPFFEALRSDPRFQDLARRMHFPPDLKKGN
jgi:TolB-like protein/Tfp pilus assembly protein PilF